MNPRGRSLANLGAYATPAAQLPSLPPPSTPFEEAVLRLLNVRVGAGTPWERWVTVRDLEQLGLRGGQADAGMPTDTRGVPVWINRGTGGFRLVTLAALATALREHLDLPAGGSITDADLASLRRRIAAIQPGVSQSELNAAVRTAMEALRVQLLDGVSTGGGPADLEQRLTDLESRADQSSTQQARDKSRTVQITAADDVWTVTHNLARYPGVTVLNADGEKVEADVSWDSMTQITITHGRPMTGWVLLT